MREFLLFACAGIALEVLFTGVCGLLRGELDMVGDAPVWNSIAYGLGAPLSRLLCPALASLPLIIRAGFYGAVFLCVELVWGALLRLAIGVCPWEAHYRKHQDHLWGLVRLGYWPLWGIAGLIFEQIRRLLSA